MLEQILNLPKVELHSHLEGTIKPHLVHQIAERNSVTLKETFLIMKEVMPGVILLAFMMLTMKPALV